MSVTSKTYIADGSNKIFSSDFKILSDSHVAVLIDGVEVSKNLYDIINNSAVFENAPTTGANIEIKVGTTPDSLLDSTTDINIVATNMNAISNLSNSTDSIELLNNNITKVNTVATNIGKVDVVSSNINGVIAVANNQTQLQQVVDEVLPELDNLMALRDYADQAIASSIGASTSATNAAESAAQAANSATASATSATSSATSATNSATSAAASAISASESLASATASAASATASATSAGQAAQSVVDCQYIADNLDFNPTNYYDTTQMDAILTTKQDNLVSGTDIKTLNGESLLGGGDIFIDPKPSTAYLMAYSI